MGARFPRTCSTLRKVDAPEDVRRGGLSTSSAGRTLSGAVGMSHSSVRSTKQVACRLAPEQGSPPPPPMLRPVVDHMAALAESREVGARVVRRVVVAVGGGQEHPCCPHRLQHVVSVDRKADYLTRTIPPETGLSVPPAAIAEVPNGLPVRTPAAFTAALGATEADHGRQLRPVDGVEEAVLAPDGHGGGCGS